MKHIAMLILVAVLFAFAVPVRVYAACGDRWTERSPETDVWHCGNRGNTITKTLHWTIYWLDGYSRDVDVTDYGQLGQEPVVFGTCKSCWPGFDPLSLTTALLVARTMGLPPIGTKIPTLLRLTIMRYAILPVSPLTTIVKDILVNAVKEKAVNGPIVIAVAALTIFVRFNLNHARTG